MKLPAISFALILVALSACSPPPNPPTTRPASSQPTVYEISISAHPLQADDPHDARPELEALVHLDVYQLDVPIGSISRDNAFWKRLDEQCLSVGAADLLYKNGLRCGVAPKAEWSYFRELFDGRPNSVRKTSINGYHAQAIELEMSKNIDVEDIFYFNSADQLEGRSYESCTNLVTLSFQPAPRRPGAVRLAICPVVRAQRRRMQYTPMNQEYESPYTQIDRLYDLNLRVDVPDDHFLVVAPGEDAKRSVSIGGRFFIKNDSAEQLEQVLVIAPTYLRLDGKPTTVHETEMGK